MAFVEFSSAFLEKLVSAAEASPRRRQHFNLHSDFADPVQRLFNVLCLDSYIRPHRHLLDLKPETLLAVRGRLALITFEEEGAVDRIIPFGTATNDSVGAELDPHQWHTVIALEHTSILFEVKRGPFDPTAAKDLALWSPAEGTRDVAWYLRELRARAHEVANGN